MSRRSLQRLSLDRIREARREQAGERYVDLRVDLRSEVDDELICSAGGRWDRQDHRYIGPGSTARIIRVHRGQLPAARWWARWLAAFVSSQPFSPAAWSLMLVGGRRGGKSDLATKILLMFAVAVPNAIIWAVSPAQEETAELFDVIAGNLPDGWAEWRDDPVWAWTFVNGTRLYMKSGYKPATLKRGRADLVLLNEAQRMPEKAFATVRAPIADKSGLVVLACNPPDEPIGAWVTELYEKTKAGRTEAQVFDFDPRQNPHVNHAALAAIEKEVDDRVFRREILGEFVPIGDVVFHAWSPTLNVRDPIAEGLKDVTRAFTRRKLGREFDHIAGADFQLTPHMAAAILHAYDDPAHPEDPILVVTDEVVVERGDENDLVDALEAKGYDPKATAVIADASGEWQDAERTKGRGSFDVFRARRWVCLYKPDENAEKNPLILERCAVGNARMKTADGVRHLFVAPSCLRTQQALRLWEIKDGVPYRKSKYAHLCDAVTYPLWRFYPRKAGRGGVEYTPVERGQSRRARELAEGGAPVAWERPDHSDDRDHRRSPKGF